MIVIDKQSRIPIYEQLIDGIKNDILNSFLEPDELIPSVRALSIELGINPNTIQKAYNELERLGITQSVPGVGRYVAKDAAAIIRNEMENSQELSKNILDLKNAGYSLDKIIEKIKFIYGGEEK